MDSTWEELFAALDALEDEQAQQKQRGLNDFNLLSSVLSVNDEVAFIPGLSIHC